MHHLYLVTGVSGSGKTTIGHLLAEHLQVPFADADVFHPPANIAKMQAGIPLTDDDRKGWLAKLNEHARETLQNTPLVIACSALREVYRHDLVLGIAKEQVHWVHLYGSFDLIRARMQTRKGHFMPISLLQSQFEIYESPTEGLLIDIALSQQEILHKINVSMALESQFGLIGLGVMGRNLARNLGRNGVVLSLYNRFVAGFEEQIAEKAIAQYPELHNARGFEDIGAFIRSLARPRKVFLMVNAGAAVDEMLAAMWPLLSPGDVVMDGGNSHYSDTERRQAEAKGYGVEYLGVGVSGGESGALNGPAIMVGGSVVAYAEVAPYFERISAKDAFGGACAALVGPGGAGHFVKMAHNGIEYAEMQLLAEVYSALRWEIGYAPDQVAAQLEVWAEQGSKSYLLEITIQILQKRSGDGWLIDLISDKAAHKGTGSWASIAASELGVPLTMMTEALFGRFAAAMRTYRHTLAPMYALERQGQVHLDVQHLQSAYEVARLVNHHQGFQLIQAAAQQFNWQINLSELARIWTNGCIIRSDLMRSLVQYFTGGKDLMENGEVCWYLREHKIYLQKTVSILSMSHRAYPCLMSALAALNAYTTAHSAAHLMQAQRDFFGAHLYERVDDPSGKKYHTDWENA